MARKLSVPDKRIGHQGNYGGCVEGYVFVWLVKYIKRTATALLYCHCATILAHTKLQVTSIECLIRVLNVPVPVTVLKPLVVKSTAYMTMSGIASVVA
jgi:hypothetical protein